MADSIEQLRKDFATLRGKVKASLLRNAAQTSAEVIRTEAKRLVPKRTSNLDRSMVPPTVSANATQAVAEIGPTAKYGAYVEFGTGVFGPNKKPIIIKPGAKGFLAWQTAQGIRIGKRGKSAGKVFKTKAGTQYAYTRKPVEIQGSRPQPYLIPAFEAKSEEASGVAIGVLYAQVHAVMAR